MDKNELRRAVLARRNNLSEAEQSRLSLLAEQRMLEQPAWREAASVALYAAIKGEVHTDLLLEDAWKTGKRVFLPRVAHGSAGLMDFAVCSSYDELRPGAFGIREPAPHLCPACCFDGMPEGSGYTARGVYPLPDLFIIPGLAFDRAGRRLGWGGGYYDRFLPLVVRSKNAAAERAAKADAGCAAGAVMRGAAPHGFTPSERALTVPNGSTVATTLRAATDKEGDCAADTPRPENTAGFRADGLQASCPEPSGCCLFVGFAYSLQVVADVPADSWDIPVDAICTEEEFLWTN